MWTVSICLLPAGIWGVAVFGINALVTLLISIAASVGTELLISKLAGKSTLHDGSAFLTGLLIGYNMPPLSPAQFYIPVLASVFAIAVVKWSFGGLGGNWMNPALAGRVFVFFSWPSAMNKWSFPGFMSSVDSVSGASPLGFIKTGIKTTAESFSGSVDFLQSQGYPVSGFAHGLSDKLHINPYYIDAFFGNIPGCIGEVSALLLLAGAVYLLIKKIVTWEIPVFYILTFGIMTWIFAGNKLGAGFFHGDVFYHLLTGGLLLGSLYMATDMVTSPLDMRGKIIFAVGTGFLTFLLRFYGTYPEGVSLAIIIMNIFVPFINRFTKTRRFGVQKKGSEK